jgi:hypothetical protein
MEAQGLGSSEQSGQRVVDFVGDGRRHSPNGGQALG